jgi:hypothetical protein
VSEIPDLEAIREWAATLSLGGQGTVTVKHIDALCDYCSALRAALREAQSHLLHNRLSNITNAQRAQAIGRIDALLAEQEPPE